MKTVAANPPSQSTRIWTPTYIGLGLAVFLSYMHNGLVTPTLPLYVESLGASEFVIGLVLAAFSVLSFTIRPWIGRWVDDWSVLGVLTVGTIILALAGLSLLLPVIWILLLVNGIRGIGWAALNTGSNAMLAHIAPSSRRGEASGYYSLFQSSASTIAPPLALWWLGRSDNNFAVVFLACSVCAFASFGFARLLTRKDQVGRPQPSSRDSDKAADRGLLDRGALLPSLLLALLMLTQPAVMSFVPLYAQTLGIGVQAITWYYLASGLSGLLTRLLLGKLSDQWGRGTAIAIGFLVSLVGIALLGFAPGLAAIILAGIVYFVGQSLLQPALLALAIDRTNPARRGAAMATYSAAFQIGIGFGSIAAGTLVDLAGYGAMYAGAACAVLAGLFVTLRRWPALRNPTSL